MKKRKKHKNPPRVNRKHKDLLFRLTFQRKEDLLELYNAVNHTDYKDLNKLSIYTLEEAAKRAIDICISKGILREILIKNRGEVISMVLSSFNQENHDRILKEESFNKGRTEGIQQGIHQGIDAFIADNLEEHKSEEEILKKLTRRFALNQSEAKEYYDMYIQTSVK